MDRLLQRTSVPSLRLLSAGVPKRHPAEVLRTNLPPVLASLKHDTVVIDCPPMDGFAETGSITTLAGSVILVVDRRRRDYLDVERSLAALHDRGAEILGIVINRSSRKSAAGKYYYAAAPPQANIDEWPASDRLDSRERPGAATSGRRREPAAPAATEEPPPVASEGLVGSHAEAGARSPGAEDKPPHDTGA